ncbi:hypothetical protein BDA99DRAFT_501253 [Phascolomyces articulosus]|uniref:Transcription activator GCR1-like domain-containing protein n=1 Tax=Phascolomyces articulosus TaxID=60185 RepID=A0AAD5K7B2_9FUNG|nr:hypothetical protein BDA99DRAFT_501253 [Phascolomyces articulosus]
MSRQVTVVEGFGNEWQFGRDGDWSVEELENNHDKRWRGKDRKWINLRKKVIEAIDDLQTDLGLSPAATIERLQETMNSRHWSMDDLCNALQKKTYYPCEETKRRKLGPP